MEAVKQVVDGYLLKNIIELPEIFWNKKIEVIALATEEAAEKKAELPRLTREEVDKMLKGSITESLIGCISNQA
jgi:hypothetical protein